MANHRSLLIVLVIYFATNIHTCLCASNISAVCSKQEQLALLKFKHSVYDDADMLSSWVGNDCCQWERVHCDKVTGKVESLHLRGSINDITFFPERLVGNEVSSSLRHLRNLKFLDLSGNDFRKSRIPEFIGSFKELSYLNLSNAKFSGIIPPQIRNLSNLKVLDLSSSTLMSDDMSWISGLSLLKYLDLSDVDLSKAQNRDMVFYMMPSLVKLSLSGCSLTNADLGTLSNSSTTLANIKHLDLGYNHFEGQFPGFFQNMTSLEFLDLSYFDFSLSGNSTDFLSTIHYFPMMRLSSCGLHNMHLSPNHLNFTIISIIQHMDLSGNLLEGRFPSAFTNMSSLLSLDLATNMLNSSVPIMPNLLRLDLSRNNFEHIEDVGIWRQCHLKELNVSDNYFGIEMTDSPKNVSEFSQYAFERLQLDRSLKGAFPADSLGRMANLRGLSLSYNNLTGPIPESLGRLRLLEELDLFGNQLTGPIPESLGRLRLLEELDLYSNQLTGPFPKFIGKLTQLQYLYLSSNNLNGSIPESLGRLRLLEELDLSYNQLNRTVPVSIGQLTKLTDLDISENSLEGVITEAHFAKLSTLKSLDASSNSNLTFIVSREWKPPFQLIYADLSSSKIINGFPQWLRTQKKLKFLRLSNASITGPLPTWLRKMLVIDALDLSHNELSGPLTNLPNEGFVDVSDGYIKVKVLSLQNNLFNESIPMFLCRRTDLDYLDLSRNWLTGRIPECLRNMRKLVTMQFSSNQLSGVIPSSILPQTSMLSLLNLNDNHLTGELPRALENIRELGILDLGDNGFSGSIPEWIGEKLTKLAVFRLHNNNFTGSIPRSLCNNSHLQILDLANNNLVGPIPHCLGKLNGMTNCSSFEKDPLLNLLYEENLIQVMKGVSLEYTTTFQLVKNMDLSSNNLVGEIPVELMSLSALLGNQLIGPIPPSIAALNFLSYLNLSHNNLSGRIPIGNQLQTLTDPSIYVGNRDLCGDPLPTNCSSNEDQTTMHKNSKAANHQANKLWFYMDIMSGFAAGFWCFIGVLLFKKHWRHKLYRFSEEIMDKIYVAVVLRVDKMKRGREST
ncbi:leucine-rich repeat protein [Artemisia annua]|uniref:Leucine-rich repeat protein n=1 Tax=Artemisia annua TaxID=35608 RepID=A0A2U1KH13_ARTAN|nr:leucine-rich repeat protein [Artemisia annua]